MTSYPDGNIKTLVAKYENAKHILQAISHYDKTYKIKRCNV
jgi:hypothetical protein